MNESNLKWANWSFQSNLSYLNTAFLCKCYTEYWYRCILSVKYIEMMQTKILLFLIFFGGMCYIS